MSDKQEYDLSESPLLDEIRGRVTLIGLGISIIETQLEANNYDGIEHALKILSFHYQYLCKLLDERQQQDSPSE